MHYTTADPNGSTLFFLLMVMGVNSGNHRLPHADIITFDTVRHFAISFDRIVTFEWEWFPRGGRLGPRPRLPPSSVSHFLQPLSHPPTLALSLCLPDEGVWDSFIRLLPSTSRSVTVPLERLRSGISYEFRVIAVNRYGYGQPSTPSAALAGKHTCTCARAHTHTRSTDSNCPYVV